MNRPNVNSAAKFSTVAQISHNLLEYTEWFFCLAVTCPYDDKTLKSLFWIGVNYHQPVDLPDTSRLKLTERLSLGVWRVSCPSPEHSQTQSPNHHHSCEPSADGELPPTATHQPEPEERKTVLTLAPEEEPHSESDQICKHVTSADEGVVIQLFHRLAWTVWYLLLSCQDSYCHPHYPFATFCHHPFTSASHHPFAIFSSTQLSSAQLCRSSSPAVARCLQPCGISALLWRQPAGHAPTCSAWFLHSIMACLSVGSALAPPTFDSTGTLGFAASPGSVVPPAPPWSVVTQLPHTYRTSTALHPFTPIGAVGSSSVLEYSFSPRLSVQGNVTQFCRPSICAYGSIGLVSCQLSLDTTPSCLLSSSTGLGCHHCWSLHLQHRLQGIVVILPSSSHHHIRPPFLHFSLSPSLYGL